MPQTVVIRKRWNPDRGVEYTWIGVPQGIGSQVPRGQRYEVTVLADGRLIYTPVRVEFQPPDTRLPGSRR